jgi:hypothetical protein
MYSEFIIKGEKNMAPKVDAVRANQEAEADFDSAFSRVALRNQ